VPDQPDQPDQPGPTPDQEAEVRRLLAGARHTEPVPAEVADRLDRVLADLGTEQGRPAGVVRLAERRRRVATLLVAAAAVVVGGVVGGQVLGGLGGSGEDAGTAGESAAEGEPEAAAGGARGGDQLLHDSPPAGVVVATVRPGRFGEDVLRLRSRSRAALVDGVEGPHRTGRQEAQGAPAQDRGEQACTPGDWGQGDYRAVHYGRSTGYVVFRRAQGDTQVADLFLCGGEEAVRSVTLPSP
jgi:hypothetical protein